MLIITPHFDRLHEWVALENRFYDKLGLKYRFFKDFDEMNILRKIGLNKNINLPMFQDIVKGIDLKNPKIPMRFPRKYQEKLIEMKRSSVVSACYWGSCVSTYRAGGKIINGVAQVTPFTIYAHSDSGIKKPKDLANVTIGVGELSGSHFSTLTTLERFLPKEKIKVTFGGPVPRFQWLLNGEIQAATLLGATDYAAEQLGMRPILGGEFKGLFFADNGTSMGDLRKFFATLLIAQLELFRRPDRYKKHWLRGLPKSIHKKVDISKFGLGEQIIFEPYTKEQYEKTVKWMQNWGLTNGMKIRNYEDIMLKEDVINEALFAEKVKITRVYDGK